VDEPKAVTQDRNGDIRLNFADSLN
jgi:hypothetical protein